MTINIYTVYMHAHGRTKGARRGAMEAMQLLASILAVLTFLAAAHRRRGRSRHVHTTGPLPVIEVGDPDLARRLLIDHADSFSNHSNLPIGVDFEAGYPKTQSITSAHYSPLWSALRSNLNVNIHHPTRLGHLVAPIQRDAAEALAADLSYREAAGGGEVVTVVRDGVYAAVFAVEARLCFGVGAVSERDVGIMRRTLHDFFHSSVDARLLARSRLARLVRWRQWRFLVGTRRRLGEVFGPVVAARRRQSRRSNGDGGGSFSSYLDSLINLRVPDNGGDDAYGGESVGTLTRRALRDDEVVRLVWEFLGSSTEAVVACIEWTLARLVTEPEVQKKLYQELIAAGDHRKGQFSDQRLQDLPYLLAVILESLRLHPTLPHVVRDVGPKGVAAAGAPPSTDGTPVRFMFDAEQIGKDRKVWTEPDEFKPERFLAGGEGDDVSPVPGPKEIKMMPFGAGRRHCPGAGMSMIHVGCFVAALVREFEWAPPADGGSVNFTPVNALFVKLMASPLRARITPRTPKS